MNVCWKQASWKKQVKDTYGFSIKGVKDGSSFCMLCYAMKGLEDTALLLWFQACKVKGLFDRKQLREEEQTAALCLKLEACAC